MRVSDTLTEPTKGTMMGGNHKFGTCLGIALGLLGILPLETRAESPKPATPQTWRSFSGTCLPKPGPLYSNKTLASLKLNTPVAISAEADFVQRFGCASGLDWTREQLVVLLLDSGHITGVHLLRVTDSSSRLQFRFRVDCGAGNPTSDRENPTLQGQYVFFATVVQKTSSTLEVKYQDTTGNPGTYRNLIRSCAMIPRARP